VRDIPYRFNLAQYFLDHNLDAGRGGKTALYYRDEQWSYRRIHEESCAMAGFLDELGVRREERVLIALPDRPEFAPTFFAILRMGAVVAMVNPLLPGDDHAYYLDYTRARVLVTDEATLARIRPVLGAAGHLRAVVVVGGRGEETEAGVRLVPYTRGLTLGRTIEGVDTTRDDIAIWLFTSGSTGKPRAAVHMHHDFAFNTERYALGVLGLGENDRTLSVSRLYFGYATGTNLMFPFRAGASSVLFSEKPTPDILFDHIERYRPTLLTSVPTMINAMLNNPRAKTADLSSLRICLSAGEALPPELYRRWMKRFGVEILDGIGSAEMFHIYITNYPGDVKEGSLGRLVPGYEARIVDPEGKPLPPGEIGTLHIKGDSAALCYWNDHEKSKRTFAGDWCFTGDQCRMDKEGYFWYEGRADDMLKVGGIWVSPLEIENRMREHEAVRDVCVVGYEDDAGLVKARAWVVLRAGRTGDDALAEELIGWCKASMAAYKAPRSIRFVEDLPRNDRGKVARKIIRQWS